MESRSMEVTQKDLQESKKEVLGGEVFVRRGGEEECGDLEKKRANL